MKPGHVDDAEQAMHKPILSFSLGSSCVFLIGTRTRADAPRSILLRSGDALLMAGHSRYCYHAVPRIIPGSFTVDLFDKWPELLQYTTEETDKNLFHSITGTESCEKGHSETEHTKGGDPLSTTNLCSGCVLWRYLCTHRVNMNARQVTIESN